MRNREVSYDEGAELAKKYAISFLEVSAKNSINVDNTFITMASEIQTRFIREKGNGKSQKGYSFSTSPSTLTLNSAPEGAKETDANKNCC